MDRQLYAKAWCQVQSCKRVLTSQVGWTLSTCAMTHVHTPRGGGAMRRVPCPGMIATVLSLALLPGTFWKVPCPAPTLLPCLTVCQSLVMLLCAAVLMLRFGHIVLCCHV